MISRRSFTPPISPTIFGDFVIGRHFSAFSRHSFALTITLPTDLKGPGGGVLVAPLVVAGGVLVASQGFSNAEYRNPPAHARRGLIKITDH